MLKLPLSLGRLHRWVLCHSRLQSMCWNLLCIIQRQSPFDCLLQHNRRDRQVFHMHPWLLWHRWFYGWLLPAIQQEPPVVYISGLAAPIVSTVSRCRLKEARAL